MRRRMLLSVALSVTLIGSTACSKDNEESAPQLELGAKPVESGGQGSATPSRGGQLVYALEADNPSLCLPEGQLTIPGMQMLRALYDPLVVPNEKGGYSPYLAESVEASADYKTWTIKLRKGIKFSDGSALDAKLVRDNLDAYRGAEEYGDTGGENPRGGLLLPFVYRDIADVEATDDLTVVVTMKRPWVAFPASLYASGRVAILGRAQLEGSKEECERQPVGTGPFEMTSWEGTTLKLERNPNYWQKAPDGKPYPYVDAVTFVTMPNDDERIASLQRGDINIMHSSASADMAGNFASLAHDGAVNLIVSDVRTEGSFMLLNATRPPFDTVEGRVAAAQAIDRAKVNEISNRGFPNLATGPFPPGTMGYLENNDAPAYDPAAAKAAVAKLKAAGKNTTVRLMTTNNPSSIRQWSVVKEMLEEAGFTVKLEIELQTKLISRMIAKDYDLAGMRNYPGDDPDINYIWWYGGGNPVNFFGFDDSVINENLDTGRTATSDAARTKAYENINRRIASQAYGVWLYYQPWAVVMAPTIHGVLGPKLPNGDQPDPRLSNGHSLLGIWIENQVEQNQS